VDRLNQLWELLSFRECGERECRGEKEMGQKELEYRMFVILNGVGTRLSAFLQDASPPLRSNFITEASESTDSLFPFKKQGISSNDFLLP
jgi:hypothetical protein